MTEVLINDLSVDGITKPIVDYINSFLTALVPGMETGLLFILSFAAAYAIKNRNNWGKVGLISMGILIFTSMRYFGVGGE